MAEMKPSKSNKSGLPSLLSGPLSLRGIRDDGLEELLTVFGEVGPECDGFGHVMNLKA